MTILDALKVLDRVPLALEQLHRALLEARRFVLAHTDLPGAENALAEIVDAQQLLMALLDGNLQGLNPRSFAELQAEKEGQE